jgi:rhamnulokinase
MHVQKEDFRCIAVDMGAGSIRVMLGIIDHHGISYHEVHRISNEMEIREGHSRWDMDRIVLEIRKGITMAIENSSDPPVSIGVDSWGVDFVHLDHRGELIERPISYRDVRTEGMMEKWKNMMAEKETFQRTGINFYIFNTLFQLLSVKNSEVIARSSKILFLPCYINYLLSGRAVNELTISSTSQLLQLNGKNWDSTILEGLNLEQDILGEVIDPGTHLGPVVIAEAEGTGMRSIAVCGHDTASVVAAIPVENPNYAYISAGTWCILGIESETPLISEEALRLGLTNERGFNNTYRILKNIVGLWLLQGLKRHFPENTTYTEMERMTMEAGPVLQVIDPDDAEFYHPLDMKTAFDTYFQRTGQLKPECLIGYLVCAYNSLCFSFRYHVEKLEQFSGQRIEVLHLVGGGSQSDYLNQRIANICDRKVVSGPVEGATLGNILIQAIAMGRINDLDEGRRLIRQSYPGRTYLPQKEWAPAAEGYGRFLKLKQP